MLREVRMEKERLIAATGNANKLREFREILGKWFEIIPMKEAGVFGEPEENGSSFEENATIKAAYVLEQSGQAAIADDSGLCVDVLDGAPGIHSARYCGRHGDDRANNEKLISQLQGKPGPWKARYEAAVVLLRPGKPRITGLGRCEGTIISEARGTGGFGYDPYFVCETGETFAEIAPEDKNRISHRRKAIDHVLEQLEREKS